MNKQSWTAADLPVLHGRTALVTGANSGVGLATATALAHAGAHVVLGVRDTARGRVAAATMSGSTEVRRLDLADLASVRAFAQSWTGRLDLLINNAGVAGGRGAVTEDGFDLQFGTNHLGHFTLTNLLLPHLSDRVVTLASGAHRAGDIFFEDLALRTRRYSLAEAYGQSKLANLLFTLELERRLRQSGSAVRSLASHPGYSATNLGIRGRSRPLVATVNLAGRLLAQTSQEGAVPTLFAATQDLPGASYVGPDGRWELHGSPSLVGRSARASDPVLAQRLWEASEELTGVRFGLDLGRSAADR
ncbi:dehydrogenase [Nesterenkonia sp. AN1]|uniref:NAD(P)-dependent dehydrogenase (Short-subunit alcohol dehydrogenase family) n=1 Tax=Nesterenkonia aurantiaca TaxID=1436010 RepID=A0A4V3EBM1_9MICC|nr:MULTISPECIES: oxidoreductase [Nesterenkonia]EXF24691.1 dehydrogenase [Nesterenkonia sp. AN1]TDS82972.1 NAD(P)-dependent dehydrogenase (short-subunit alcohol dehydrogenase family) [Nesterenkonia aurantiaca]